MKKMFGLIFVMAFLVVALVGCASSSPSSVVRNFYKYVENQQYDKAASLFSQQAIGQFGISKLESYLSAQSDSINSMGGVKKFEIIKETIIKDKALVEVKITMGNGQEMNESANLVKEDNDWKLSLTK
jgi:hypothetical protein